MTKDKKEEFVRRWAFLLANSMKKQQPEKIDDVYVFGVLKTALPMILDKYEAILKVQLKQMEKVA